MDIEVLQEMTALQNQATMLVAHREYENTKLEGKYLFLFFLVEDFIKKI